MYISDIINMKKKKKKKNDQFIHESVLGILYIIVEWNEWGNKVEKKKSNHTKNPTFNNMK